MFPDGGESVGAVAAGLVGGGKDDGFGVGEAFDLALEDAELRGIDEVVGGVDGEERRANFLEVRAGVVVARGFELVEEVVRVVGLQRVGDGRIEGGVARRLAWASGAAAGRDCCPSGTALRRRSAGSAAGFRSRRRARRDRCGWRR